MMEWEASPISQKSRPLANKSTVNTYPHSLNNNSLTQRIRDRRFEEEEEEKIQ